jgi:RNA polymerase sigma factor (sigma-70 family)
VNVDPTHYVNVNIGEQGTVEMVVVDGWDAYMHEVGRVRRLTPTDELELGRRIVHGDTQALHQMVEANLRLVIAVAKRYRGEGIVMQDLVQEGNIGLLRAAQKFDYRKGYRFSTYAIWWIRQAVRRAVAHQAYAIHVPVHIQEGRGQAERALTGAPPPDGDARAPADAERGAAEFSAQTLDLARRAQQTVSLEPPHRSPPPRGVGGEGAGGRIQAGPRDDRRGPQIHFAQLPSLTAIGRPVAAAPLSAFLAHGHHPDDVAAGSIKDRIREAGRRRGFKPGEPRRGIEGDPFVAGSIEIGLAPPGLRPDAGCCGAHRPSSSRPKGLKCYPTAACPRLLSGCGWSRHSQCRPTKQRYAT